MTLYTYKTTATNFQGATELSQSDQKYRSGSGAGEAQTGPTAGPPWPRSSQAQTGLPSPGRPPAPPLHRAGLLPPAPPSRHRAGLLLLLRVPVRSPRSPGPCAGSGAGRGPMLRGAALLPRALGAGGCCSSARGWAGGASRPRAALGLPPGRARDRPVAVLPVPPGARGLLCRAGERRAPTPGRGGCAGGPDRAGRCRAVRGLAVTGAPGPVSPRGPGPRAVCWQ